MSGRLRLSSFAWLLACICARAKGLSSRAPPGTDYQVYWAGSFSSAAAAAAAGGRPLIKRSLIQGSLPKAAAHHQPGAGAPEQPLDYQVVRVCDNSCGLARNGMCDDGRGGNVSRPGVDRPLAWNAVGCDLGRDCDDCGPAFLRMPLAGCAGRRGRAAVVAAWPCLGPQHPGWPGVGAGRGAHGWSAAPVSSCAAAPGGGGRTEDDGRRTVAAIAMTAMTDGGSCAHYDRCDDDG